MGIKGNEFYFMYVYSTDDMALVRTTNFQSNSPVTITTLAFTVSNDTIDTIGTSDLTISGSFPLAAYSI